MCFVTHMKDVGGCTHAAPALAAIRMKGPSYEQGTRLQAAAGLHHLMANHWHVLVRACVPNPNPPSLSHQPASTLTPPPPQSETLDKQFEKPLRQHLDAYRTIVHVRGLPVVTPISALNKFLGVSTGTLVVI